MSNINELTAKLKAAAQRAISEEGETWWNEDQLASDYGLALHKTDAKFIAAASPGNILALTEALEKREELRSAANKVVVQQDIEICNLRQLIAELEALTAEQDQRLIAYAAIATKNATAASEARTLTVKLPDYRNSPDMHTKQFYEAIGFNQGLDACVEAILAAGIKLQIEGE